MSQPRSLLRLPLFSDPMVAVLLAATTLAL
jgi:hypothetical protein